MGDVTGGQPLDLSQYERSLQRWGQCLDGPVESGGQFEGQDGALHVDGPGAGEIDNVDGIGREVTPRALLRDRRPVGDPVQPGLDRPFAPVGNNGPQGSQEGVLDDVLCEMWVTEQPVPERVHTVDQAVVQIEDRRVAGRGLLFDLASLLVRLDAVPTPHPLLRCPQVL